MNYTLERSDHLPESKHLSEYLLQQRIARIQNESRGIQIQKKRWEEVNSGFLYNLEQEKENLINYFLKLAEQASLETLLDHINFLFIHYDPAQLDLNLQQSICCVVISPEQFTDLLTDYCYIFINTCFKRKKLNYLQNLADLLQFDLELSSGSLPLIRRFHHGMSHFKSSVQFSILQLFFTHHSPSSHHWSERYKSLKLLAIAHDPTVSEHQRHASEKMYQALKNRYKFQLAMYLTKREKIESDNPSLIHPTTLQILNKLIHKREHTYTQAAAQFLAKIDQFDFASFKEELSIYLLSSISGDRRLKWLPEKINQHLFNLYPQKNHLPIDEHLKTKTVDALVRHLIHPKNLQDPNHPFTLLMIQQDCISLSILLLKLILIAPQSYTNLLLSLNLLLTFYSEKPQDEAPWLVSFLETFQVIFTLVRQEPKSAHSAHNHLLL